MTLSTELEAAANGGDPAAQFALARELDQAGRHGEALSWLTRAADAGAAGAAKLLGVRLFVGRAAPHDPAAAVRRFTAAAEAGDGEACGYMAGITAAGRLIVRDWNEALDWLARGAEAGDEGCRSQLRVLARDPAAADWPKTRASVDLASWLAPAVAQSLSTAPRIRTFRNFLTPQVCAWLIDASRDRLGPAPIYDDASGGPLASERRSNTNCVFPALATDVIQELIRARIAAVVDLESDCLEPLSVLHYEVGQEFRRHVDFLDPTQHGLAQDLALKGQRVATFLVYLNDDFDQAETEFPVLALKWKGPAGDAILFYNVDATGAPDRRTLHAGRTPTRGEKWLLSQFIREKPQPLE